MRELKNKQGRKKKKKVQGIELSNVHIEYGLQKLLVPLFLLFLAAYNTLTSKKQAKTGRRRQESNL